MTLAEDAPGRELRAQDEILQVLFWMRGEGLGEVVRPGDLRVFLDPEGAGREVVAAFHRLTEKGLVERVEDRGGGSPDGGSGSSRDGEPAAYRLTEQGILEGGRRFADEFADIAGQAHGQCDDPECFCHTDPDAAVECAGERHARHGA